MSKYTIRYTSEFKKSLKKFKYRPKQLEAINKVVTRLAAGEILEEKFRDHKVIGTYVGCRECHIEPDLLLIYQKKEEILILHCVDVGSHTELFSRKKSIKKTLK